MKGQNFVIHTHNSKRPHQDFRLEHEGVLKSWAVPKGLPLIKGPKHLAVSVEDHPIEYGNFEGTIPEGEYGAGSVSIWDNGSYEITRWDPEIIDILLHGRKAEGRYILMPFPRPRERSWLIFKG